MPLPWRPEEGSVVRMFCHITHQDGTPFEYDSRALLEKAIKAASEEGLQFFFWYGTGILSFPVRRLWRTYHDPI